ncbi:glycosyltransferase family 4 protein [Neorhizobium alkalisoli]|uniref:Glycosyltransferase involved in cell wall biosynthesis n=1 Tax=Neorhizobium alkalisoli TaxID=528178 RepID=A0A561QAM4_9HYPH|nr:glycosyltransferase family 4 protein [Neorhizobium alkalisoli]TWF47416.1 glycosyltransferase involved in cell wall biosynthesis [Neorhizobium alkalisoli]
MKKALTVLVTAPSLAHSKNVSGVSSVVRELIAVLDGKFRFRHLRVGSEQNPSRFLPARIDSVARTVGAFFICLFGSYDILHANVALNRKSMMRELLLCVAARLRAKPIILHLHGGTYIEEIPHGTIAWLQNGLFDMANTIVTLSERERRLLTARRPDCASKFRVVYNGTRVPTALDRPKKKPGRIDVVFAGRLVEEKGIAAIINLGRRIKGTGGIFLHIYGEGNLRPQLEELADNSSVFYHGIFSPSDREKIFNGCDIMILPSLRGEGMPMVVVEGMAAGVVPVCTQLSSVPEIITDGQNGVLLSASSGEEMHNVLLALLKDPDHLDRMSTQAHDFARSHLDSSVNMAIFDGLYRRATNSLSLE